MTRGISRWAGLFDIAPNSSLSLQDQIRRKVALLITTGAVKPGQRLPSSRELAAHLKVARNTVALAYQHLIVEGLLIARSRSGVYVNAEIQPAAAAGRRVGGASSQDSPFWRARLDPEEEQPLFMRPDWHRFPYPFVHGRFDRSLFPVAEWREAVRRTLSVQDIEGWADDPGDADDHMLIDELRTKVLPRRGVHARPQEILVTSGAQQALHLVSELTLKPHAAAAMEDPGDPDLRALLQRRNVRLTHQPVDDEGMIVDERLEGARALFVSPAHQRLTGAVLSQDRRAALLDLAARNDAVVVEDDFENESHYVSPGPPALRAGEDNDRIAYAATLARTLAPGLRLGVLVGHPRLVRAARRLRRLTTRHPPLSLQRATAHLIALGQYDAIMLRTERILRERLMALRDALNHYFPRAITISPLQGGKAIWVRGPESLDARRLLRTAELRGVLIEPVGRHYAAEAPRNVFRLGVSSIPAERIRAGVAALAEAFREVLSGDAEEVAGGGRMLDEAELRRAMAGATLLTTTVYGEPCTIELSPDGTMRGRAGFANEDTDEGRWWIEDGLWRRQWGHWAYGEAARFRTVVEDSRIRWYSPEGRLIDSAVYLPPPA